MEASWIASMLLTHPLAIAALVGIPLLSALALYSGNSTPRAIPPSRLAFGYVGIFVVCVFIAATSSFISPEEAFTKWRVPSDKYWSALFREFLVICVLLIYSSFLGFAIVGAPVTFALARRGLATVPWVLVASVVISSIASLFLTQFSYRSYAQIAFDILFLVGGHLLLALGFCVGARLPWGIKRIN